MARIERKLLAHFINTALGTEPQYERLGADLEEYTPEMSATVETKKNILGENRVFLTGYEKTAAVETFYADDNSPLYERLQEIIDMERVLDGVITDVVEVKLWKMDYENAFPATQEKAFIEITSYGGDTSGYRIGFKLHFTGEKTEGRFNPETRTFMPN